MVNPFPALNANLKFLTRRHKGTEKEKQAGEARRHFFDPQMAQMMQIFKRSLLGFIISENLCNV